MNYIIVSFDVKFSEFYNFTLVMWKNALVLRRYILNYLRVKCYDMMPITNSQKKESVIKQMW